MEYCIAAASSPFAPPNCSSNMLPNSGSGSSTRTVYISFLMWWYIDFSIEVELEPRLLTTEARTDRPYPPTRRAVRLHGPLSRPKISVTQTKCQLSERVRGLPDTWQHVSRPAP